MKLHDHYYTYDASCIYLRCLDSVPISCAFMFFAWFFPTGGVALLYAARIGLTLPLATFALGILAGIVAFNVGRCCRIDAATVHLFYRVPGWRWGEAHGFDFAHVRFATARFTGICVDRTMQLTRHSKVPRCRLRLNGPDGSLILLTAYEDEGPTLIDLGKRLEALTSLPLFDMRLEGVMPWRLPRARPDPSSSF